MLLSWLRLYSPPSSKSSSPLTHPWAHAHILYSSLAATHRFLLEHLDVLWHFLLPTHTPTHTEDITAWIPHIPHFVQPSSLSEINSPKGKDLFIFWQSQEIKSTFPAWIDKKNKKKTKTKKKTKQIPASFLVDVGLISLERENYLRLFGMWCIIWFFLSRKQRRLNEISEKQNKPKLVLLYVLNWKKVRQVQ